jgi:signal transduction histidine kinase
MDLLTNLREWSRLQTGRMDYCLSEVDIISIINEVAGLLNASALHKTITIVRNTPPDLVIMADKAMISTVLRNLIANSIKFSYQGSKVVVSAHRYENEVRIEVKDFGVGIKKETVARLFRIESSFSTPGTQDEEGSGLGLILCKEFVSRHGGEIWVESEFGKGSKFTFTLPLRSGKA